MAYLPFLKPAWKKLWVDALLSGEYVKAHHYLFQGTRRLPKGPPQLYYKEGTTAQPTDTFEIVEKKCCCVQGVLGDLLVKAGYAEWTSPQGKENPYHLRDKLQGYGNHTVIPASLFHIFVDRAWLERNAIATFPNINPADSYSECTLISLNDGNTPFPSSFEFMARLINQQY